MTDTAQDNDDDWGPLSGLPGNPLMWVLIASELLVFGAIFTAFSFARMQEVEVFATSQDHLNRLAGAINTMVLLTSGLFAALAVYYEEQGRSTMARCLLAVAAVLGIVFLAVKSTEYRAALEAGISAETNTFYMFYFLATGFHALHVVFGIFILIIVGWKHSVENIVTGVSFWHMVDLVWLILFPVVYLMR